MRLFFVKKTVYRIVFRGILEQGCHDLEQCLTQPCGAGFCLHRDMYCPSAQSGLLGYGEESHGAACAKIVADTDLYETDNEVQNLIDWVCLSEQIKENNNTIRNLTGEYKKIEPDCREGVRAQLERMKELRKENNGHYEKQNDLKGQKWKIEKSLER